MSFRRETLEKTERKKKSEKFLFPMLETNLNHKNKYINHFIECSLIIGGFPQIVLIFDNVDYEPLTMDIYKLQNHHTYINGEYDDDNKEICLFFDIPLIYKDDFELFIQGKYSQFSQKYKDLLTKIYGTGRQKGFSEKTNLPNVSMYDVINPKQENKQLFAQSLGVDVKLISEILDPPNIEFEQYKTIKELKEIYGIKQQNII